MKTPFSVLLLAALLGGCHSAEEGEEPVKPPVAFEGNLDPKFVATWKTADGNSTYVFNKDGKYILDSLVTVKGQAPMKTHSEGEWKVKDDRMLFRDAAGNVVPYAHTLQGDKLTLMLTGSLKNKTNLVRQ